MYGMTLSRIAYDATPAYPAPEMACIVVTCTASMPNERSSGASAIASPTTEQFGFVTM
jgi:hypothetical protein